MYTVDTVKANVSLHELVETKFPHLNAWWGHMLENVHWVTLSQKKSLYRTLTFWGRCGWGRKFSEIRYSSILRTLLWSPQMKKILHVWYNLFSDDLATWNTKDFSTFPKGVTLRGHQKVTICEFFLAGNQKFQNLGLFIMTQRNFFFLRTFFSHHPLVSYIQQ